jgi:putative aminopeptidase FrvX
LDRNTARKILEPILASPTAPYLEDAVAAQVIRILDEMNLPHTVDGYGNIVVRCPGAGKSSARIGFMAHMDHPGFEVIETRSNGVRAAWHGGVMEEYFAGAAVRFYAGDREYTGTVRSVTNDEETNRVGTALIACDSPPPVGALGMWDVAPVEFLNGMIRSRALDDLAGCAMMLCILSELADREIDAEVWMLFTRAEEVGFVGAIGLARSGRIPASLPVVSIEMSRATPGATPGMGPVVRLGDKSSVFDNSFLRFLRDTAHDMRTEHGLKSQQMLMEGGACEATALDAFGFRTAGLALPLGNYHNMAPGGPNGPWTLQPEEINFNDFLGGVDLCVAVCERFPGMQVSIDRHRRKLIDKTNPRLQRLAKQQRTRSKDGS